MPGAANPQAWNRYSYVLNNPIRYNDPSGHAVSCDAEDDCKEVRRVDKLSGTAYLKESIRKKFGITMSDEGDKNWDAGNLLLAYSSLQNINTSLNGNLKSQASGWTFKLKNQNPADGLYHGWTSTDGTKIISFFTLGNDVIRQMNIYHEVGHLLDNVPGSKNVFTNAVGTPNWVSNGFINPDALISGSVPDPYYGHTDATQAYNSGASEEWADAFANYVAGNINLVTTEGQDMYDFVKGVLP